MSDPRFWGTQLTWPFLEAAARDGRIPIEIHKGLYYAMPANLPCHVCGDSLCSFLHLHPLLPQQDMGLYAYQLRSAINVRNGKPNISFHDIRVESSALWLPKLYRLLSLIFLLYPLRLGHCPALLPASLQTQPVTQQRKYELQTFVAYLNSMVAIMIPGFTLVSLADSDYRNGYTLLVALWQQEAANLHQMVDAVERLQELLLSLTLEAKIELWRQGLQR